MRNYCHLLQSGEGDTLLSGTSTSTYRECLSIGLPHEGDFCGGHRVNAGT